MSNTPSGIAGSPLGLNSEYCDTYAPELLFPVPRLEQRTVLGLVPGEGVPFFGADFWNAYELSWLNARGKPVVAVATFRVPAASPNIVESKSLKLYLNSFAQTPFADLAEVRSIIERDLSAAAGAQVGVFLWEVADLPRRPLANFEGVLLDRLDVEVRTYRPEPEFLRLAEGDAMVDEVLVSHLLRSNCPVTGQPDWASVRIAYRGAGIEREGLLAYLISFRQHTEFHEHCVERIYLDIWRRCHPERLSVYARYTRRGGLDINPYRSSHVESDPENGGDIRQ